MNQPKSDRRDRSEDTEKPFEDEVRKPKEAGSHPTTPDDKGDAQRQQEAKKTTQRTE